MTTGQDSLGHIKGTAALEFLVWYREEYGRDRMAAVLDRLKPADRSTFDLQRDTLGLVPSMWYPAALVHRALDEVVRGLSLDQAEHLARRAGKAMADAKLRGLQRVLFSLIVTPEKYCKFVQRAWDLNYDNGTVEQRILSPTCHEGLVSGWRSHHPVLCDLHGELKVELYRRMGCKDIREGHRRCISRGDTVCGSTITWR